MIRYIAGFFLLLISPSTFAAVLIDNFEDGNVVSEMTVPFTTFTDSAKGGVSAFATDGVEVGDGYNSVHGGFFKVVFNEGGIDAPYAGVTVGLNPSWDVFDASQAAGIRFAARGTGALDVQLPTTATQALYNHYSATISLSDTWQLFELPFEQFAQLWGEPTDFDLTTLVAMSIVVKGSAGTSISVAIDDIEFYNADEALTTAGVANPILLLPKINQHGYLPNSAKRFTMAADACEAGATFYLLGENDEIAYEGKLSDTAIDATASAGEWVYTGDFSELTIPGEYSVSAGDYKSHPFEINQNIYVAPFRATARAFSLIRSGVAIDDAETGLYYPGAHYDDARLESGEHRDLSGGWYNAGDFGKWIHMASLSASFMMLLYELQPDTVGSVDLNIPESGDDVPDILDEARFGLEWMLKMQNDDGSVLHKVDSGDDFGWGKLPSDHDATRIATAASSVDAGFFVGAMLIAERIFKPIDSDFAAICRDAADSAFGWLRAHREVQHDDSFYQYFDADENWMGDTPSLQEYLFALGEMVRATQDDALASEFADYMDTFELMAVSWLDPAILGYFAVASAENLNTNIAATAKEKIILVAQSYLSISETDGYEVALSPTEYIWGSNENLANRAISMIMAWELSGDASFRDGALLQLDYLFGRNSLDRSYVPGFGENAISHPYHWAMIAQGIALPGWMAGGANGQKSTTDAALNSVCRDDTPPQKCHADVCAMNGSYASNEGTTSSTAALMFLTGYFAENSDTDITPEDTDPPADTDTDTSANSEAPSKLSQSSQCNCSTPGAYPISSLLELFF